jgi:hypothetical protein
VIARLAGPLAACALVATVAAAAYSVVRYRPAIVLAYLGAALLLGLALALAPRLSREPSRIGSTLADRRLPALALIAAAVAGWHVPTFTYLPGDEAHRVTVVLSLAALAAGLVLLTGWRRSGDGALVIALVGYLSAALLLLRGDPAPAIDVWYSLQGAADALGEGRTIYREVWAGPPGVMAAFTYLPWTALLLAPARWLVGDVRAGLAAATVVAALAVRAAPVGRGDRRVAAGWAAVLLLLPGTSTQVEQAWTEPLLLACLGLAAVALLRNRFGWAMVAIAVSLACKQHVAVLLPLLAAWPRFGLRRTALTAAGAALAVMPWFLADPRAMVEDTVAVLVRFPPMRFADSLYILAINEFGWTPPFWATGAVVALTLLVAGWWVHRRDPDPGEFVLWAALVLLVANLVNKQAFYNQYWLVAGLVILGWAAARSGVPGCREPADAVPEPAGLRDGRP